MPHKKGHKTKTSSQKPRGRKGGRSSLKKEEENVGTLKNGHLARIGDVERASWYE